MFSSPHDDTGGRVSLLPSLIKAADKYLAMFPQYSLWSSCLFQDQRRTLNWLQVYSQVNINVGVLLKGWWTR